MAIVLLKWKCGCMLSTATDIRAKRYSCAVDNINPPAFPKTVPKIPCRVREVIQIYEF